MALMTTCYDPSGIAHTVESIDAREYIKSGHYTMEPPEPAAPVAEVELIAADQGESNSADPAPEPAAPVAEKRKPGPKPKA